jgi:hypothetical protein
MYAAGDEHKKPLVEGLAALIDLLKQPAGGYHFFLSHKQSTSYVIDDEGKKEVLAPGAGDGVGHIRGKLHDYCSEDADKKHWVKCWYDQDQDDKDIEAMMQGVKDSENFLLFLSKNALTSSYVQKEIKQAIQLGKNIIVVHETDASKGRAHHVTQINLCFFLPARPRKQFQQFKINICRVVAFGAGGCPKQEYGANLNNDFFGFSKRFGDQTNGYPCLNDSDIDIIKAKESIAWERQKELAYGCVMMILKKSKMSRLEEKSLHALAKKAKAITSE